MRFIQRVTNKIPSSGSKIRRKNRKLFFFNVDATFLASTDQTSLKEKKTYRMLHKNRTQLPILRVSN